MTRDEIHHELDRMLDVYMEAHEAGLLPLYPSTAHYVWWLTAEYNQHCDEFGEQLMEDWLHETVDAWDNSIGGYA